jgi:uncharacterized protein
MKWLIDGHNLIGQMPTLRLDDPHDEEKLLVHLRRYQAKTGHSITVVFDAGAGYKPPAQHKRGGVTVQFVSQGHTADQALIRHIRQVKNRQEVIVVTSDRAVEQVARQAGLRVLAAREFAQQLLPTNLSQETDEGSQANPRLSADEVDEWLALFSQRKV